MTRVVVLGLMGQYPLAGMAWQVLHHLEGLRRLGCEVLYVENNGAPPYSPRRQAIGTDARENLAFLRDSFRRFGFDDRWAYFNCLSNRWSGRSAATVEEWLIHADVVINLCAASLPDPLAKRRGCLVYLETDPVREQVKLAAGDPKSRAFVSAHDVHFTYGVNIGTAGCRIPDGGIEWRPTRPPVVVDWWSGTGDRTLPDGTAWRSIASYRNVGKDVVIAGVICRWSKEPSFERVMQLPQRMKESSFELALVAPDQQVRDRFTNNGWTLRSAHEVSRRIEPYRRFIRRSRGEFSVEKEDQVKLRSGWLSDRSVCFLAAGKPCVVQDTGFADQRPMPHLGLHPWRTLEEAVEILEMLEKTSPRQIRGEALKLAAACFEAKSLLRDVLGAAGVRLS